LVRSKSFEFKLTNNKENGYFSTKTGAGSSK